MFVVGSAVCVCVCVIRDSFSGTMKTVCTYNIILPRPTGSWVGRETGWRGLVGEQGKGSVTDIW